MGAVLNAKYWSGFFWKWCFNRPNSNFCLDIALSTFRKKRGGLRGVFRNTWNLYVEAFYQVVNGLHPLSTKSSMMDVPHGPKYTPLKGTVKNRNNLRWFCICHSIRFLIYSPNHRLQSRLQLQVQLQRSIFHLNMIQ